MLNYLQNPEQRVVLNGQTSVEKNEVWGVPEGLVDHFYF